MRHLMRMLFLIAVLSVNAVGVLAQSTETTQYDRCTAEQTDALNEVILLQREGFAAAMEEIDWTLEPSDAGFVDKIFVADRFTTNAFRTVFTTGQKCYEAFVTLQSMLGIYNRVLLIMLLQNAAEWSTDSPEDAETFMQHATLNQEQLTLIQESAGDIVNSPDEQPDCDQAAMAEMMQLYLRINAEILPQVNTYLEEEDYMLLFSYTEGVSYAYQSELYPTLNTCKQVHFNALMLRLMLDDLNIGAGLLANSAWEATRNEEASKLMYSSAAQHLGTYARQWEAGKSILEDPSVVPTLELPF